MSLTLLPVSESLFLLLVALFTLNNEGLCLVLLNTAMSYAVDLPVRSALF